MTMTGKTRYKLGPYDMQDVRYDNVKKYIRLHKSKNFEISFCLKTLLIHYSLLWREHSMATVNLNKNVLLVT